MQTYDTQATTLTTSSPGNEVLLRNLDESDAKAVTAVHMEAFPDSALTKLGAEAVRRYYEWQFVGPHDMVPLGAYIGGEMQGFCFGGIFRGALSGFLNKNRSYLALSVLKKPWLLTNPIFRDHLLAGVRNLKPAAAKTPPAETPSAPEPRPFGILSIAVNPTCQGSGVGKLLMRESEAIARQRGFQKMRLTVSADNQQAISFYERGGWKKVLREDEVTWQGRMEKALEG